MVKFKLLAAYYLPHSVECRLILFLRYLTAFASYVSNRSISITTYIIIIIIIISLLESFSHQLMLMSLSSNLQDSSPYSSRSHECYSLDIFDFPTNFEFFHSLLQALGDSSEWTLTFMFQIFFSSHARSKVVRRNGKINWRAISLSLSLFLIKLILVFWSRLDDPSVSQNHREFYVTHSPWRILVCAYDSMVKL